jgi:hypothetical protein
MNWWANLAIFILSLPFSVWLWACFMALFDNVDKLAPSLRLCTSAVFLLALMLIIDRDAVWPFMAALVVVIVFHVAGFWILRKLFIGVDSQD